MTKHTILFLAANPLGTDRLALDQEARVIREELERSRYRDQLRLETRLAAQPMDLLRELRKLKPTVVHFSGHGNAHDAGAPPSSSGTHRDAVTADEVYQENGLFFQGPDGRPRLVSTSDLAEAFEAAGSSVKLVVLSACHSEIQAEALRRHVGCVVAVDGPILDNDARAFAAGFYGGLAECESVSDAFRQGIAAIRLAGADAGSPDAISSGRSQHPPAARLLTSSGTDPSKVCLVNSPKTTRRCSIVIKAKLADFDPEVIARVRDELRLLTGDVLLEIIEVQEGSVKLTVSLSPAAARQLERLRDSGGLGQVCGFDVSLIQVEERDDARANDVSRAIIIPASEQVPAAKFSRMKSVAAPVTHVDLSPEPFPSPGRDVSWEPGPLVLYVDDDRGNRVVFEQSLNAEFNLMTAQNASEALDVLERHEVAVVVSDMRMPSMSGEELLRIVKERHPQVIRMVVTAYADVEPILRAINEGLVARYIVKPWIRTELVQVLRWATEAWMFSRDSAALHRRLLETERLATLGSIAGMLVHDLKQPLMSLLVNVEHLRELATAVPVLRNVLAHAPIPAAQRSRLLELVDDLDPVTADLRTSGTHLSELISGLRELGRPRDPRIPVALTEPLPVVRHAMTVCQELATPALASISYEGPGELPRVRMSATELTQVLINVLANGAQAVAARGRPHGRVSIVARPDADMLELQIRDDGIGMEPDVLSRVGTPFFTTRLDGTGLGLAQCQRLVGTAGGRFRIESEYGIGTTVTIILPTAA